MFEEIELELDPETIEVNEIDEIKKESKKPGRKKKKKETEIYIRPEEMWQEIMLYYKSLGDNYDWHTQKIKDKKAAYPEFPLKLAKMINDIAERMTYLPNFIKYSWKTEMIGDATLKMVKAVRDCSFKGYSTDKIVKIEEQDGERYFYKIDRRNKLVKKLIQPDAVIDNREDGMYITYKSDAFNYFTGISAHSFINRIKKENLANETLDAYKAKVWDEITSTEAWSNVRKPRIIHEDESESFDESYS